MAAKKDEDKEKKDNKKESSKKGRKKKKSEIVPWSKKERGLVFWVMIATVIASGLLALSARSWKLPNLPRIKIPTFQGETIVIEGNKEGERKAEEAVSLFRNKVRPLSGVYGLYVIRLDDGSHYGVNEDEIFVDSSVTPSIPLAPSKKESNKIILMSKERGKPSAQEIPISRIPLVSAMSGFMNILRIYTTDKNRNKVENAAKSISGKKL